jgi:hypothetical protein
MLIKDLIDTKIVKTKCMIYIELKNLPRKMDIRYFGNLHTTEN